MLVNLSNIFTRDETEKQLSAEFDFSAENVSYDATFEKPVAARLDFKKGINETFIELTVQATAVCTCARCLKLFERQFDFTRNFIVSPENLTETENEIPVDSNRNLDVEQLVLQELSLEIPSVLLCKEDCRGLCPVCGCPLEENCGCQLPKRVDPRLSILKQLLDNDE